MKHHFSYLLAVVLLFTAAEKALAQKEETASDSVYHYEGNYLYKQQRFYEKWKNKAEKHKWSKEFFNVLFDPPAETTPKHISKKSRSSVYRIYEGKTIREINFKIIKPFGEYENGFPTDSTDSKLEKLGNKLHTRTKTKHLRRLLSFNEGEKLDIKQLEDNEEMLNDLPYVDELYVFVTKINENNIAIEFLIKERFAWTMSYQARKLNAHKFKIYNKNLFGRGHYLKTSYYYNPNKDIEHNITLEHSVPSIGKTLIRSTAILERTYHNTRYGLELSRGFIDYKTKFAGGIKLNFVKNADYAPTNAIADFDNNINYQEKEVWAGFSVPYNLKKEDKYARYRKAITARIYHLHFSKHPEIKADSNRFLLNTTGFLFGYNVSKKKLCLSNMIYNYGKVENIPYGSLAQLFVGGAFNQWQKMGYAGFNFERAFYSLKRDHYFSMRLYAATFFNQNRFLDGLLNAEARYISKLYRFRNTGHRHFLKLRYTLGFNATDDFLDLYEHNGLRNFKSQTAHGSRKLVLNLEDVFFSPYTIAGFRSTFFSFADLGYISRSNSVFNNDGHLYAGIGLGLRLHNNNFIFKTFQISFSLFLKRPEDVNFFRPDASSVKNEAFENFQIDKPRFYFERENLK